MHTPITLTHKKILALCFVVLGLTITAFCVLNWGFWKAQISYELGGVHETIVGQSQAQEKNMLRIPSLGISAPIIYPEERTEAAFQQALTRGVVHYPGSANVGAVGNAYVFGHSSDYAWSSGEYKNVFALLPKISIGADIQATNENGMLYTYMVVKKFVVSPNDVSVLKQDTGGKKLITLQTSYPIGTALKRYIVVAELE